MKCRNCGNNVPENSKFCNNCGSELSQSGYLACSNEDCPDYGKSILPPEAKFCPRCGYAISRQRKESDDYEEKENPKIDFDKVKDEINILFKFKN